MAAISAVKNVKVVLKLESGSQTVPNCASTASDDALLVIGTAVAALENSSLETLTKVVESTLVEA